MRLALHGVGVAAGFGGREELFQALSRGIAGAPTSQFPAMCRKTRRTETSALEQRYSPRQLRRIDHFTRMCLLAGHQALDDVDADRREGLGLVLCSGYGPAQTTFTFLDSLIDFGEACASPLAFSHSVHNIPAATLAILFGQSVPCLSLCQTVMPVSAGLRAAGAWLFEERVSSVLFIAVDEQTDFLQETTHRLREDTPSCTEDLPVGEGAVALLLTLEGRGKYGCVNLDPVSGSELPRVDVRGLSGQIPVAAAFALVAATKRAAQEHQSFACRESGPGYCVLLEVEE